MFISIHRLLMAAQIQDTPDRVISLRQKLVDELLLHSEGFNIKLDKIDRKYVKLMRFQGQFPSLELLLVVSFLFKIKIFVYFWPSQPVVYQFEDYDTVIHLQCISGIHFNPLIELRHYSGPSEICTVVDCSGAISQLINDNLGDEDESETETVEALAALFSGVVVSCNHYPTVQSQVRLEIESNNYCAIMDTGAELSLMSSSTLEEIPKTAVLVVEENLCNVIGLTGVKTPVLKTATVSFNLGKLHVRNFKFAIVPEEILQHCFLIGLDFMARYDVSLNLCKETCKSKETFLCRLRTTDPGSLRVCAVEIACSHQLRIEAVGGNLLFALEGEASALTALSLLCDAEVVEIIQNRDRKLKMLKKYLISDSPTKEWQHLIKQFSRYRNKLSIVNGAVVYSDPKLTLVISFHYLVELCLALHHEFAHVGRDKLLDLLAYMVWHPSKYQVVNDICTTCHQCQLFKIHPTTVLPPTLRIVTSYPFELVAADLISLPRTPAGYVGILMVVDHYSKWVSAVPIKNKQSATIIKSFREQIFPFLPTVPAKLLTYNGPEFVSSNFELFLSHNSIKHQLTTPYCPRSNGAVERVNRTVEGLLCNLMQEGSSWDQHLSKAIRVYNGTVHSQLGLSPSKFLLTKSHSDSPVEVHSIQRRWKRGKPKFSPFRVGQFVLMKEQPLECPNANKLSASYKGPLTVTKINENGVTY